jgi:hypothetical protein
MRLLLVPILAGLTLGVASAQLRQHPPGLRAEMVVTGKVSSVSGNSFRLVATRGGTYTVKILPSTIIRQAQVRTKLSIRPGMSVTAQGFVHQRIIDATRITVLGKVIMRTKKG